MLESNQQSIIFYNNITALTSILEDMKNMGLTNNDVQIILGIITCCDKRHDIAAWFGENQARIVEAEKGSHGQQPAASPDRLPPKGAPGPKGRRLIAKVKKVMESLENGDELKVLKELREGADKYQLHEN